jgi:prepilin-type processing-associated H-X9-DG protein
MTITLRKQLGILIGGALVCLLTIHQIRGVAAPREKLSADEVSRRFMVLISSPDVRKHLDQQGVPNFISSEHERYFNSQQIKEMIIQLSENYAASAFKTRKIKANTGKEIIRVVPLKGKPNAEFVCVNEKYGYKIDLVATYGRWNKLSGIPLAQRVYDVSGAILPDLPRTPDIEHTVCISNLKKIGLGMMMYVQDYDEKYPQSRDWNQSLEPYLKDNLLYNCPTIQPLSYGYAYNSAIESVHQGEIENATSVVALFDSQQITKNASGGLNDVAYRHKWLSGSGANVAFADGHVRFIAAGYKWGENRYSFTPKHRPLPAGDSSNWRPLPATEEP